MPSYPTVQRPEEAFLLTSPSPRCRNAFAGARRPPLQTIAGGRAADAVRGWFQWAADLPPLRPTRMISPGRGGAVGVSSSAFFPRGWCDRRFESGSRGWPWSLPDDLRAAPDCRCRRRFAAAGANNPANELVDANPDAPRGGGDYDGIIQVGGMGPAAILALSAQARAMAESG